jgi:hypothetical protein
VRKIVLHIEELVLHGFATGSRHTIGDAVRAEIERRLGEGGVPEAWARGGAIDRIAAGEVRVPALPRGAGSAIGAAVHRSLTSSERGGWR